MKKRRGVSLVMDVVTDPKNANGVITPEHIYWGCEVCAYRTSQYWIWQNEQRFVANQQDSMLVNFSQSALKIFDKVAATVRIMKQQRDW